MNTIYDVDFFISKFEKIPENRFTTCVLVEGDKRCFIGHCLSMEAINLACFGLPRTRKGAYAMTPAERETIFAQSHSLCLLINPKSPSKGANVAYKINNGDHPSYPQPTPKQRILAALMDIKANQALTQAKNIIAEPAEVLAGQLGTV